MQDLGRFFIFMRDAFVRLERFPIIWGAFIEECIKAGYKSIFIVVIVSGFTGAVSAIQTAFNLTAPYIQDYIVALVVRDTMFSLIPSLMGLIYAGKVGSFISSEIGTMKITEQIDAIEVMGINPKSYLVFPKIAASLIMFPMITAVACFMSLFGGFITVTLLDIIAPSDYVIGIRTDFNEFIVTIIIVKSIVVGLIVPSISSYQGYFAGNGVLEVGKASTLAVVKCCIAILMGDYLITQLLAN